MYSVFFPVANTYMNCVLKYKIDALKINRCIETISSANCDEFHVVILTLILLNVLRSYNLSNLSHPY